MTSALSLALRDCRISCNLPPIHQSLGLRYTDIQVELSVRCTEKLNDKAHK